MKKIISLILIILQILTVGAFADGTQLTETQKNDLYKFGIMTGDENGDLRLSDNITRAEAVKMICAAGNIAPELNSEEKFFNDVSKEHWAYKWIYAAKDNGIADGDGNGNFNPEESVTNEEIVKMTVCLLGYKETAEIQGGYPAGYTAAASRIGVTKGLYLTANTPATRGDVAVMIYNALDIPVMVKKSNETDDVYIILDGKNGVSFSSLRKAKEISLKTDLMN